MFENFLRVLGKDAPEHVQILKLWEDLDTSDLYPADLPDNAETVGIEWLKTTDWYNNGGYRQCRAAEYAPIGEQLDMQYHDRWNGTATHDEHIASVKAKWPKQE